MAALILPSRRVVQPQGPVEVDWSNPLTSGLVLLDLQPGIGQGVTYGKADYTIGAGSVENTTGQNGRGLRVITETNSYLSYGLVGQLAPPYSVFLQYVLPTAPTNSYRLFGNFSASAYGYVFSPSTTAGRFLVARPGANTVLTGGAHKIGVVRSVLAVVDATHVRYYEDGLLVAGPTAHGGVATPSGALRIGADNAGSLGARSTTFAVALYERALSDFEAQSITASSQSIWQLARPLTRSVYFLPADSGGGGAVDASASMSSAPSVLAGVGALPISGSASITAGAATMAAAGSLPVDSSSAMATAPAVLAASGALLISGSAAMSTLAAMLSASGVLPIAGTAAQTTGAAVMSADGVLGSDATASASMATAPATVSGAGVLPIAATASQTTGSATMAASGDLAGMADGSASMSTAPAATAAQGLLQLLAAAGMQTSTPILVAFGSEPITGPAIDWTAPGARATVPRADVLALVPGADITATVPAANVRAIVPFAGDDMDIIKTFDHQAGDTEIYELAYGPKYLDPLSDTPATLAAFAGGHAGIASQVSVGAAAGAVVKFSVDGTVPVGSYTVSAQLATAAGRKKTAAVQVNVEA